MNVMPSVEPVEGGGEMKYSQLRLGGIKLYLCLSCTQSCGPGKYPAERINKVCI